MIKYILFDWGGTLAHSGTRQNFIYGNIQQKLSSLYPDTIATLKYLHKRGYKLGIVSNTEHDADAMYSALEKLGLHRLFSCIVYSNDNNMCAKPCTKIYHTAMRCLSNNGIIPISPSEVLFVGNNYEKDIIAPRMLGMYTAFFPYDNTNPYFTKASQNKVNYHDLLLTQISDLTYHL